MVAGQQRVPGRFAGFLFPQACRILRKLKEQKIRFNHHIIMNRTFLLALTLGGLLLAAVSLRQGWFQGGTTAAQPVTRRETATALPKVTNARPALSNVSPTNPTESSGQFREAEAVVGIGTALAWNKENRCPEIKHVIQLSPAAMGGVTPGWLISKIDDIPTSGLNLKECVDKLRGPVGSKVRLELIRPEESATNTVELVRQRVQL
jgi:hypothetical protein